MAVMNATEQNSFLENMNKMYEDREAIFRKREQEYQKQRSTLSAMMEQMQHEKEKMEKKAEEQGALQKELDTQQKMLQDWYNEEVQARKKLEGDRKAFQEEKETFVVQARMEMELAKNEKIRSQQLKEEYEHRLSLLGLLLDKQGEDGAKASEFFTALVQGEKMGDMDALQAENESLREQIRGMQAERKELMEENEGLKTETAHLAEERSNLLRLVAKMHGTEKDSDPGTTDYVPNSGTQEGEADDVQEERQTGSLPEGRLENPDIPADADSGEEQETAEDQEEVYEELTATVLQNYLKKNEKNYQDSEIRHSEDGEQLHLTMNGLNYAFLFSAPAAFEISARRKNGRVLQKVLAKMNEKHPDVKFRYEDGVVYATGYFVNTMSPELLMERVGIISHCFQQ